MRLLGFDITRSKAVPPNLSSISSDRGWLSLIREPFTGAWQMNLEQRNDTVLTYHAIYACVTLIATDVSKCRNRLVEQDENGIWNEVEVAAFSPVIRKPNKIQNRIKFYEQWVVSKLLHGNTYVLLARDERRVVVAMYVLDPTRVKVLLAPDGSVYYQLNQDNLARLAESVTVPASEILHDVMVPFNHPLCGISPLTACGLPAMQGLAIQRNSSKFFANGSRPGGVLSAPNTIDEVTAKRIKDYWDDNFTGVNAGKVAVLGDGLKYESMVINAHDAQLVEQLKWSAEVVCSTFHVPAYKVGIGAPPPHNNIEALEQQYYSQCLQKFFECIELCMDEGLGLTTVPGHRYGTSFDEDDLLRMDTATLVDSESKAVGAGIKKLNEARKRLNLGPIQGGNTSYLQQQNYSVAALDRRDRSEDPFAKTTTTPSASAPSTSVGEQVPEEEEKLLDERLIYALLSKGADLNATG